MVRLIQLVPVQEVLKASYAREGSIDAPTSLAITEAPASMALGTPIVAAKMDLRVPGAKSGSTDADP